MGKFIGGILKTIIGAVLLVVPGGQGFGIALIAAGVTEIAATLLSPSLPKPESGSAAIKSPLAPRVSAYGRSKLFGAYAYFDAEDEWAADVFAVHDCWPFGAIDGIERIYLGDQQVQPKSGGGWGSTQGLVAEGEDGQFGEDHVSIYYRLGANTSTYYSQVNSRLPRARWGSDHRGDGVATACTIWEATAPKNYAKRYPNGQQPQSWVARWQRVYDWRDPDQVLTDPSTWRWTENAILHVGHYKLLRDLTHPPAIRASDTPTDIAEKFADYWALIEATWAAKFAPTIGYWTAAADDADLPMPLKAMQTIFVEDAENGDTTITLGSTNGLHAGMSIALTSRDNPSHTEVKTVNAIGPGLGVVHISPLSHDHKAGSAANWSTDPANPASEPRYRSCVAHKHTDPAKDVIGALMAACDGWMAPRADGALVIYSGRYYEPTVEIGPDEIISYSWETGIEDEAAVNEYVITTESPDHDYGPVECESWRDDTDIAHRGKLRSEPLELQIPSFSQGRRLAKRKMAKANAPARGTVTTNSGGRRARGERYVRLRLIEAGAVFYDGPAEIVALTRNLAGGGVTFQWIAADPNIDGWNPATEEGSPAPVGNRIAPQPLPTPAITSATVETGFNSASGTTGAFAELTVSAPDRADMEWFIRSRVVGASVWGERSYSDIDPGASVTLVTEFLPVDEDVEIEVSYKVGDGRVSDWSETETVDTTI